MEPHKFCCFFILFNGPTVYSLPTYPCQTWLALVCENWMAGWWKNVNPLLNSYIIAHVFRSKRTFCTTFHWPSVHSGCIKNLDHIYAPNRVAEVVRRCEGPAPKSLESDENFRPQHTLFCRDIDGWDLSQFTHLWEIFGQKKCFLGLKAMFPGQEVHHYMVYFAYYTE